MCTLTHFAQPSKPVMDTPFVLHGTDLPELAQYAQSVQTPRFQVVPAGNAFFHIKESSTGRVRGFREDHNEACALARLLESRIELLSNGCLR
ncbi:hypothetical protein FE275_11370 [Pseudomonas koreensis]|uniref:Uncharacterized protein n=1 Tax=Pseudomonas fluorescens TaxID=294 RepID=A0A854WYT5_PSEFL|nr:MULTISPECIES: hypothetical protein [Pseudomonas]KAA8740542.1 hypothetical protein FE275_11370 [Pseudomonas koreensis]MBB6153353.1 hypothetical protein [Pseudomonas sp. JAI115]PCM48714.1 hypothetical protein CP335_15485 [Pseudomonas fluorescens]POA23454.1 hypothetical protein C1895_19775 [Pseudomonas sp. FW305-3-2-15-E-TSA4]POA42887.1 hypothetical protein C1894_10295 [Pseudomonas sp. FW305-3-2-15-E-TSA2]